MQYHSSRPGIGAVMTTSRVTGAYAEGTWPARSRAAAAEDLSGALPARAAAGRLQASRFSLDAASGVALSQSAAGMRPSRVPVDSTSVPLAVPLIQRKLATESPSRREAGGVAGVLPGIAHHAAASLALPRTQRTCTGCEEENTKPLQAESAPSHRRAPLDPRQEASLVLDVVGKGGGQPLPPSVRADMEGRFAADFSDVRIHTDVKAAKSAAAVSARAYTVGNEVGFDHGAFAPGSPEGEHTLAHELAHVQQQRKGPV